MTVMQRVRGAAHIDFARTGLRDLRQQGSAKVMVPRVDGPVPELVFLNTAGGVTGGDRLAYSCRLGGDMRATATTQTAERAYRASDGTGLISVDLTVGQGARLDWLPQETILFQGSATRRETRVDLGPGATVLMVEMVVLGRAAMGEAVDAVAFDDIRSVTRGGALVYQDHLSLNAATLADPAALGGARALASLAMIGPDAENAALRLTDLPDFAGLSAWNDRLMLRMHNRDPAILRRALIRAIVTMRGGPMPRVWQPET